MPSVNSQRINELPPHDAYISATAGKDKVLYYKRPSARDVVIDPDPEPLKWWSLERPEIERHQCCGIEWLQFQFGLFSHATKKGGRRPTPKPVSTGRSAKNWLVMLDPPYPREVRSDRKRIYQFEPSDTGDDWDWHMNMLSVARRLPTLVVVCCYPNPVYDEQLADWRTVDYFSTVRSGARRKERLYLNYPPPTELHDYRYLGRNKRERDKIGRRHRNLIGKLKRLPPMERQAFIQTVREFEGKNEVLENN